MEPDSEKPKSKDVINLDLDELSRSTQRSYEYLMDNPHIAVIWSLFVKDLAHSDSKYAKQAGEILSNASNLIELSSIHVPVSVKHPLENEKDFATESIKDLSMLGITIDSTNVYNDPEDDPGFVSVRENYFKEKLGSGLLQIAANVRDEYAYIAWGNRIFDIARTIMKDNASGIPLPTKDSVYFFIEEGLANGHWYFTNDKHVLSVEGPVDSSDYLSILFKSRHAQAGEYYSQDVINAVHELSHAVLFELVDEELAKKVFSTKREANLLRALSEGYAIQNEKVAIDILDNMVPDPSEHFNYSVTLKASDDRLDYLERIKGHEIARHYADGDQIIDRLISQLGLEEMPRQDQVKMLAEYLKTVDWEKALGIKAGDGVYGQILEDPINNIPTKEEETN